MAADPLAFFGAVPQAQPDPPVTQRGPFFHGTSFDIHDHIRPGLAVGHSHFGTTGQDSGQLSQEHAFATTDEKETAWNFANHSAGETGQRARVYEVHPNPQMREGNYKQLHEYIAPSFGIKRQIDTMPGRQGTMPNINWRQFAVSSGGPGDHMNHPDYYEQQYGHPGSNLRREQNEANETYGVAHSENADRSAPLKGQMALPGIGRVPSVRKTPVHEILDLL